MTQRICQSADRVPRYSVVHTRGLSCVEIK
jgi:hypothetical protein